MSENTKPAPTPPLAGSDGSALVDALREARERVSSYSRERLDELSELALAVIFPAGRWACANGHLSVCVAKGTPCGLCGANGDPSVTSVPPNAGYTAQPQPITEDVAK